MTLKSPTVCIFCKKNGASKQHIFPDRLKSLVPRSRTKHAVGRTATSFDGLKNTYFVSPKLKPKNGDLGARFIRRVCAPCNNKWLEPIERKAFLHLAPLIQGQEADLDQIMTAELKLFLSTFICVLDQEDPATIAISQSERSHIYDTNTYPQEWIFLAGILESNELNLWYKHYALNMIKENEKLRIDNMTTHVSTVVMGRFIFQCITGNHASLGINWTEYTKKHNLSKIDVELKLLGTNRISDADIKKVSNEIYEIKIRSNSDHYRKMSTLNNGFNINGIVF